MTTPGHPDPVVDRLINAWVAWEDRPGDRTVCIARLEALRDADLPSDPAHDLIGAARRAGYSIPDAIQTALNELAPQEAA